MFKSGTLVPPRVGPRRDDAGSESSRFPRGLTSFLAAVKVASGTRFTGCLLAVDPAEVQEAGVQSGEWLWRGRPTSSQPDCPHFSSAKDPIRSHLSEPLLNHQ